MVLFELKISVLLFCADQFGCRLSGVYFDDLSVTSLLTNPECRLYMFASKCKRISVKCIYVVMVQANTGLCIYAAGFICLSNHPLVNTLLPIQTKHTDMVCLLKNQCITKTL